MTARRTTSSVRSGLLVVGAVLGTLCVLSALAAALLGVTPLVFRSGSMSPEIPTGSLALARSTPAADLRVGDVVSVVDPAGTRITHRVVELTRAGDTAILVLKGDANDVADAQPYVVTDADRVVAHAPYLGRAVAAVSGPVGIFAGGMLSGVLLVVAFGPSRRSDDDDGDGGAEVDESVEPRARRSSPVGLRRVAVAVVATAVVAGAGGAVPSTLAAFTDASTATSTMSALTVTQPAALTCANNGGAVLGYYPSITLSWTDVAAFDFQVTLSNLGGSRTYTVSTGSSQNVPGGDLAALLAVNSTINVAVVAYPAGTSASTWTSSAATRTVSALSVLGLANGVRC
ncbi:signal peptidase I [Solicola sp. PLA-1-18]|uniref:signal peptidase I n=1 Tax=Solicola sp. PLA-1-18 TaxID=3380532 RepID=UPI003B8260A3